MNTKNKIHRIIFFLPVFGFGGASESIIKLAKFLNDRNFSISLISVGKNVHKNYLKKIGCEVYELSVRRALFSIFKLRNLIKKDLNKKYFQTTLISNIHYANIIALISCFGLKGIKIIFTERSSLHELSINNNFFKFIKNKLIFYMAKNLYRHADLVIANSKYEKNYIRNKFNVKKIKYIYPPSILKVKTNYKTNRNYNNLKKIIYVGNLFKEKGPITIVKAISKIKNDTKFILEIYGEGYEKKNIKDFIIQKKLSKKVFFRGFNKDKSKIFKNKDLFINASWYEGLPNALVQSINNNIFPICSRSPGGNSEVIKFGKLGLYFKAGDSNDLKKKILFFFKKKLKLNEKLRIDHLKNFTEEKSNKEYLNTLKNIK